MAIAALLVIVALSQVPALVGRGFWLDEAFSLAATDDLGQVLRRTRATMATFYLALAPWSTVSFERWWLRLLPLLFALAALGAFAVLALRRFGRPVAAVATVALASSHLFLSLSTELRSYSLALLATTVGWFALLRWVEGAAAGDADDQGRWRVVWALAMGFAVLTHGLAAVQLVVQVAVVAAHPDRRRLLARTWPAAIIAVLTAGLWLAGASETGAQAGPSPTTLVRLWVGLTTTTPALRVLLTIVAGLAILAGALAAWRSRGAANWYRWWLLAWALGTPVIIVAASPARSYLRAAYLLGSVPGLCLLIGVLAADERWRRRAVPVAIAGFALAGIAATSRTATDRGDQWRDAAASVAESARPGSVLVVPSGYRRSPFDVGWAESAGSGERDAPLPLYPSEPIGSPRRYYEDAPASLAARILEADAPQVFVVDQADSTGSSPIDGLLDEPAIEERYAEVERTTYDNDIVVVVLEPRS